MIGRTCQMVDTWLHGGDLDDKGRKHKLEITLKIIQKQWLGWSERRDLNSGPPVPQTGALTGLRYAPNIGPHYSQRGLAPQHAPATCRWSGRRRIAGLAAP